MEYGYAFLWWPFTEPVLIKPDGESIKLVVENYVPFLDEDGFHRVGGRKIDVDQSVPSMSIQDNIKNPIELHNMFSALLTGQDEKGDSPNSAYTVVAAPAEVAEEDEPPAEGTTAHQKLVEEANSLEHLMPHLPKNPDRSLGIIVRLTFHHKDRRVTIIDR